MAEIKDTHDQEIGFKIVISKDNEVVTFRCEKVPGVTGWEIRYSPHDESKSLDFITRTSKTPEFKISNDEFLNTRSIDIVGIDENGKELTSGTLLLPDSTKIPPSTESANGNGVIVYNHCPGSRSHVFPNFTDLSGALVKSIETLEGAALPTITIGGDQPGPALVGHNKEEDLADL